MITYKVAVDEQGNIFWYNEKGQLHREGGPAICATDGTKSWWRNDNRHREDGPAIEWARGDKSWYLNGVQMTKEEHARAMSPIKELSVGEIEKLLGYRVKIIKAQIFPIYK